MDKQKLEAMKLKVNEALDNEKDLKPFAAERVSQIVNDAIVGMPPEKDVAEDNPEAALAKKLKTQIDAAVANSDITPELAAKLEAILAELHGAAGTPGATGPIPPVQPPPVTAPKA